MSQNNIKTILSIDDKDVKSKLEGLKKYYSETFKSWAASTAETKNATQELSLAQQRLTKARYEVAAATERAGTVGKEELKTLNAEITASRNAVAAAKQRVSASKEATAAMWSEMEASKKAQSVLGEGTKKVDAHSKSLEQQWNQMIRVARWAGTLIGVYYGLSTAWNATIGKGIELGRQVEDMANGIAALTSANTSNIASNGAYLNAMEKFRVAGNMTKDTMIQLRKAAIDTPATFAEISAIFQQAYVSTSKMGKGFGLTINDITKNTVALSTNMANIAGAIGMPMQKALEETRSLMSGQASGDSLIASLLFGSPAAANAAMRKAQEAGELGVKKLMDRVMGAFEVLAKVDSYTKSIANAQGAYEQLITKMSEPVKNDLKEVMDEFTKTFDETTEKGKSNVVMLTHEFDIFYGKVSAGGTVAIEVASIFTEAFGNIATAASLTANLVANAFLKADDALVENFDFGDYFLLGLSSATQAIKIFIDYMETEFKRSSAVIMKYRTYLDPKNYIPLIQEDTWNGQKIITTRGTIERAKLNQEIVAIDRDMASRTNKSLDAVIKTYDTLAKARRRGVGVGGAYEGPSLTQSLDPKILERQAKEAEANKTALEKAKEKLEVDKLDAKEIEKAIKALTLARTTNGKDDQARKDQITALRESLRMTEGNIRASQKEIADLNTKAGVKAETEANKENRRQLSAMEKIQQRGETAIAMEQMIAVAKEANFNIDERRLSPLERVRLTNLNKEEAGLTDILQTKYAITDSDIQDQEVNEVLEKIYKNRSEYSTLILKAQQGITAEDEKQLKAADKLARLQFAGSLKELYRSTKSPESQSEFERIFGKDKLPRKEAYGLIDEAKTKYRKETFSITDPEQREKVQEDLNKFVDGIKNKIVEIPDVSIDVKLEGWDEASSAFASLGNAFKGLVLQASNYKVVMAETNARLQTQKVGTEEYTELERKKSALINKNASDTIQSYSGMIGAASDFYGAESKEAKRLHEVQKALSAAKMAMDFANMAQSTAFTSIFVAQEGVKATAAGTVAVATAAQSSPWTGFATAAAMVAMLASLGIMLGVGGGSDTTSYDTFASQAANTGTGSVLGDTTAQSESITNSLGILSDLAKPEFRLISQMNKSLISIDQKIGGLSANILQAGGFAVGEGYVGASSTGLGESSFKFLEKSTALTMNPLEFNIPVISGLIEGITSFANGALSKVIGGVFGGGSETSLHDAGVTFSKQFITAAMTGLEGQSYQVAKTVSDGGWFRGDKTSYNSYFSQLDEYTRTQFQLVLGNLYDTALMAGEALDTSTSAISADLSTFVVDLGKISLKDKTGEQIKETLTAVFGRVGDELATKAFPALLPFQAIGEGLFETMVRVSGGMEEAGYYIDRLGMAFNDVVYTDLINKKGDVALEALTQSILELDSAVYGTNNGVVQIVETFNGTADQLFETYSALSDIRVQMTMIGSEAKYLTSQTLLGAGGVNELGDAINSFFDSFMGDSEKLALATTVMQTEFVKLGRNAPVGAAGFKSLVSSLDLATESGQELYGRILLLSDGFAELISQSNAMLNAEKSNALELAGLQRTLAEEQKTALDAAIDAARAMLNTFTDLIKTIEGQITGLNQATTGLTQRDLISAFWGKRTQLDTLLSKDGNLTTAEASQMETLVGELGSLSSSIQGASVGDNSVITKSLIGELGNIKDELSLDEKILTVRIVDAGGQIINASTEGTLTLLAKAIDTYNANIEASLQVSSGDLSFSDFKAGGLLTTPDEIAFRQSFTANSATSYSAELDALRSNLAYMTLSTTNIKGFLSQLMNADSTGYGNIIEFMQGLTEVPETVVTAFDQMLAELTGTVQSYSSQVAMAEARLVQAHQATASAAQTAEVARANREGALANANYAAYTEIQGVVNRFTKIHKDWWRSTNENVDNAILQKYGHSFNTNEKRGENANQAMYNQYAALAQSYLAASRTHVSLTDPALAGYLGTLTQAQSVEGASAQTLANLRAQLAAVQADLSSVPSFSVGTSYLQSDTLAQVHRGEMIIDPQSSNVLRKYGISTNDYLTPVMNRIYNKLDEMAGYMNRLDRNIESAMQGRALRTVV